MDPLGIELNNVAHYRLANMLYLKIQKGKNKKTAKFQSDILRTAAVVQLFLWE